MPVGREERARTVEELHDVRGLGVEAVALVFNGKDDFLFNEDEY